VVITPLLINNWPGNPQGLEKEREKGIEKGEGGGTRETLNGWKTREEIGWKEGGRQGLPLLWTTFGGRLLADACKHRR
jgi:hypothetical protein